MTKDFQVAIKVRNNRILAEMKKVGIETAIELSRRTGVSASRIGEIINLKASGLNLKGDWREGLVTLADFFGCTPTDLIPASIIDTKPELTETTFEVDAHEVRKLTQNLRQLALPAGAHLDREEIKTALRALLNKLTPKQEQVIRRRYGMDCPEETLDEVAERLGVSRERVRQIEMTAIRRISQKHLKDRLVHQFGDGEDPSTIFAEFDD